MDHNAGTNLNALSNLCPSPAAPLCVHDDAIGADRDIVGNPDVFPDRRACVEHNATTQGGSGGNNRAFSDPRALAEDHASLDLRAWRDDHVLAYRGAGVHLGVRGDGGRWINTIHTAPNVLGSLFTG